jgi:hypothetical protein
MSGDPFANTTTVKNILQHIISPKLVTDGSGGYVSKTDLVNVHNIVFAAGASNEDGTVTRPFTTQCGTLTATVSGSQAITVYHSRVTTNSVIFAVNIDGGLNLVFNVIPNTAGSFVITCGAEIIPATKFGWFIARF